jgi:hypothetical protein
MSIKSFLLAAGETFHGGRVDEIAQDWEDHGFTDDNIGGWIAVGCWDASSAAELREAGFRTDRDELRYAPGAEIEGMDAMYAFCNCDRRLDQLQIVRR